MAHFRSNSLAAAVLAGALFSGAAQAGYVLTEVTRPGSAGMALWDINNAGQAVGYSISSSTGYAEAFVYQGGSFTALSGPAGAVSADALGISDTGVVVGSFANTLVDDGNGNLVPGASHGYLYSGGSYSAFNVAGATETILRGISSNGRYITGYYGTSTASGLGFVYDLVGGVLTNLSLANSLLTIAQGVNDTGDVVGSDVISGPPTTRPGWIYRAGTGLRTDTSIAGATRTAIRAISDSGGLAGWYYDSAGVQHGFYGPLAGYEQIDFAGAVGTYVEGSNNAGWIVGGIADGGAYPRAFIGTPVPEPASAALVLLSLGLLWGLRRPRALAAARRR